MWYSDIEIDKKKFNPILQKMIIHTFVDLVNSILEINSSKNKNFFYDIVSRNFTLALKNVYIKKEVIKLLSESIKSKIKINKDTKKLYFLSNEVKPIMLTGKFHYDKYRGPINKNNINKMYQTFEKNIVNENINDFFSEKEVANIYDNYKKANNKKIIDFYKLKNNIDVEKFMNQIKNNKNVIDNINKIDVNNDKSLKIIKLLNKEYNNKSNDIKMVINEFLSKIIKISGESYQLKNRKVFIRKK